MNNNENSSHPMYKGEEYNYNSENTTCYAELSISGKNLDFDKINSMLNFKRYSVYVFGVMTPIVGVQLFLPGKNKVAGWTYSTKEQHVEIDVSESVERLRKRFSRYTEELKAIRRMYPNCRITVEVVLYNDQKALPAISLTAKQIEFMSAIGADFDIDLYN